MKASFVIAAFAATATALPFNMESILGARTTVATPPPPPPEGIYPPPGNFTAPAGLKKRGMVMTPPTNETTVQEISLKKRTMTVPDNCTEPAQP